MKTPLTRFAAIVLLLTSACSTAPEPPTKEELEQKVAHINAGRKVEEYAKHCRNRQQVFDNFQQKLAQAATAEFCRVTGDCCCSGGDMPPVKAVKLSHSELTSLRDIMSHASAAPPIPENEFLPQFYVTVVTDGRGHSYISETMLPPTLSPHAHIIDRLSLKDSKGNELMHIDCLHGIVKTTATDVSHESVAMLPDEWHALYINYPARQRYIRNIRKAHKGHEIVFTGE